MGYKWLFLFLFLFLSLVMLCGILALRALAAPAYTHDAAEDRSSYTSVLSLDRATCAPRRASLSLLAVLPAFSVVVMVTTALFATSSAARCVLVIDFAARATGRGRLVHIVPCC